MRRAASLSVDLDNQWSYMKIHGDPDWETFPSYLDRVIPHVLDLAERHRIGLTTFVVGQDAELDRNSEAMAMLGESRHEVANHSFHHEPWLHLKSRSEIDEEIVRAGEAITRATGRVPKGFRGPGFSLSQATVEVLVAEGYDYDASTLPTFIGPLARAFYFRRAAIDTSQLEQRERLFGQFGEVFRPLKPYRWATGDSSASILEIPVTTMPVLRAPIHATYLLYLARYSPVLSRLYLRTALGLCSLTGVEPSLLLHSLDFVGGDEITGLEFFPGMDMSGSAKRHLVDAYVTILGKDNDIVTMGEHARKLTDEGVRAQPVTSLA